MFPSPAEFFRPIAGFAPRCLFVCLCLVVLSGTELRLAAGPNICAASDSELGTRLHVLVAAELADDAMLKAFQPVAKFQGLSLRPLLRGAAAERLIAKLSSDEGEAKLRRLQRWWILESVDETALKDARTLLLNSRLIERVETAYAVQTLALPNDPLRLEQHAPAQIRCFDAYELVRGEQSDVIVGIVDGGTEWRHEDLLANAWLNDDEIPDNGIDDDGNGFIDDVRGWNFADNSADPTGLGATPNNARHGTHVAGLVAAVSDNALGVLGVSWNAKFLPVNVSSRERDRSLVGAYEGLLYAALNGAQILNASWGRTSGRWSDFEFDILEALEQLGCTVIAAAGNSGDGTPFYPAIYPQVLAVANVDQNSQLQFTSTRASWVDLSAPGNRILSTSSDDGYFILDGSSQSAAITSGVAALALTATPTLTPRELRQHLIWSSVSIDEQNPDDIGLFGSGIIDAVAAVSPPRYGLETSQLSVSPADGDRLVTRGEEVHVAFEIENLFDAMDLVVIRMTIDDPNVVVLRDTVFFGPFVEGSRRRFERNLSLWIRDDAFQSLVVPVVLEVEGGGRTIRSTHFLELLPTHGVLRTPQLRFTHTANGRLGYANLLRSFHPGGVGFGPVGSLSLIGTGSLVVGDDSGNVVSGLFTPLDPRLYSDFRPNQFGGLSEIEGEFGVHGFRSEFADSGTSEVVGVRVTHESRVFDDAARDGFVLSSYQISPSRDAKTGVSAGLLVDWEMGTGLGLEQDQVHFDRSSDLLWAESAGSTQLAGVAVLRAPGEVGWSWLWDLAPDEPDGRAFLFDASNLQFRPRADTLGPLLEADLLETSSETGGVVGFLRVGPFDLQAESSARLVVSYVVGESLTELREQLARSEAAQQSLEDALLATPRSVRLLPAFPNPFNPSTALRFALPSDGHVDIVIYDTRGRRVKLLQDGELNAGYHERSWAGVDDAGRSVASGVYYVELQSDAGTDRQKLTLVR